MISKIKPGVIEVAGGKKRTVVQVDELNVDKSSSQPPSKFFKHNEPYSSSHTSRFIHFTSGNPILPTNKVIRFMSGESISVNKHSRDISHSDSNSSKLFNNTPNNDNAKTNKFTDSVTSSGNSILPVEKIRVISGKPGNTLPVSQANTMIKLVKPISQPGVRNKTLENVYIDQNKILTALRRLKETSNRSTEDALVNKNTDTDVILINGIDTGEDGLGAVNEENICSEEEEIFDSKTETIHVWIGKDVDASNQVNTPVELSNPIDPADIESVGQNTIKIDNTVELPGWYSKLAHTMTGFLELGCMVDAYLQGEDGDRVPAHQIILAHISPVLASILPDARREDESVLIMLTGVPTSFIRDFLHAVYTGVLSNDINVMQNVFLVAHLLGVRYLGTERLHTAENEYSHQSISTAPLKQNSKKNPPATCPDNKRVNLDMSVKDGELTDLTITSADDKNNRMHETNSNMNLLLLDSNTHEISELSVDEPIEVDDLHYVKIHDNLDDHKVGGACKDDKISKDRNIHSDNSNKEMDDIVNISETTIEIVSTSSVNNRRNKNNAKSKIKSWVSSEKPAVTGITKNPVGAKSENADSPTKDSESGEYKVIYQPADRPCPICTKPRITHKNREIAVTENKGNHKGNYYKCCQCSASKLTAKKLFLHLENHVAKKFQCALCNKGYSYKNLLVEHEYKIHGEGKNERYCCPYEECKYEARYKQTLHTHITDHHKGVHLKGVNEKGVIKNRGSWGLRQPLVTCQRCMKIFKRQHFYSYHMKSCLVSSDGKYECSVCWKKHNSKFALNKHIKTKHPDPANTTFHLCEICNKSYSSQYSLYNHKLLKHSVNSKGERVPRKLFPCKTCGKVLTTSVKLKTHIEVIHLGIKDYNCRFCEKQFTSKSNLMIHEGTAHTGILPYTCDDCNKSFVRKSQLRQHREQVHGIVTQPDPGKLFTTAPPDTLVFNNQQQLPLVEETIQRSSVVTSDEIILHEHQFDLMPTTTPDNNCASDSHHHQSELVSQVIEDTRFNTGSSHHSEEDPRFNSSSSHHDEDPRFNTVASHHDEDPRFNTGASHHYDDDEPQLVATSDSHHHGIHEDMENSSLVMHDIENGSHVIHDMERLDDDGVLNDGHYYLVGENDIHPVQVGDVIIPMELVQQEQSGQQ